MGQYIAAQAKEIISSALPKDKQYFAAFNYGEVIETQEETGRLRIKWQIPYFLSLRRETSDAFISPVFNFLGSQCYLMLSPFVDDDVEGWSDIYVHSKNLDTSVTYNLGIQKVDGTVQNISSFTGTAEGGWFPPLQEKFLKMDDLLERKSTLLSSDVLTVIFTIRKAEASDLEDESLLETECISDNKEAQDESLLEIECVNDNKAAQVEKEDVISLPPGSTSVEENPKTNVKREDVLSLPSDSTTVEENPNTNDKKIEVTGSYSDDGIEINPEPSSSTFASKETQTDNSEVHKKFQERSLETKSISKLTRHLEDLLLKSKNHDVNTDVQNRHFKAHKFILKIRSPEFSSMFQHNMADKASGKISVQYCDPGAFSEFLKYVNTGKVKIDSAKSAVTLYYAGDKYNFQELKQMSVRYLKESTFENTSVCEVIKMAIVHGETDLRETAFSFFSKNLEEILQTNEWKIFLLSNVDMANDMLKRAVKNLSKKAQKREIVVSVECPSCLFKQN